MRDELDALEQICSPTQLALALGMEPVVRGSHLVAACPSCGEQLHILPTGYLCAGPECTWRAGGIYDLAKGPGTYSDALDTVAKLFPDRHGELGFTDDSHLMVRAAGRLAVRRSVYDFFLGAGDAADRLRVSYAARNDLRKTGDIDPGAVRYCVFPMSPDEQVAFEQAAAGYGQRPLGAAWGPRPLLIPYFSNHHTVAVAVHLPHVGAKFRFIKLEPSRYQFSGLMQAIPSTTNFDLVASYAHMLSKNSEFARSDQARLALHMLYDPQAPARDWVPGSCVYHEAAGAPWGPVVMLARDTDVRMPDGGTVGDKLVATAFRDLVKSGITPATLAILEQLQLFEGAPEKLQDMLRQARQLDLMGAVRARLSSRVIDVAPGGLKLVSRDDGYFWSKDGHERRMTNFTVSINRGVRFSGSRDVFYDASVHFAGDSHNVLLPSLCLDSARKLRQEVQRAVDTEKGMPVMTEMNGQPVSLLMRYLAGRPADVPAVEGISELGWNHGRTAFYGPGWVADQDGVKYAPQVHHPASVLLRNYTPEAGGKGKLAANLPVEIADIIAQAAAMIFRAYHGVPPMAVPIARGPEAEMTLRVLFGSIGQRAPLHYTDAQWRRGGTHGFPAYGAGASYWQTKTLGQPVFMLAEKGLRISQEADDEAGDSMRHVLHTCVEWLLSGEAAPFEPGRSVDPSCVLGKEGKRIIELACGVSWEVREPYYRALDTLLAALPFERTREHLTFNINRQQIELRLSGLPAVDPDDLQVELGRVASGVCLTPAGIAANDADMAALLETYYQDKPSMVEIFAAPDS